MLAVAAVVVWVRSFLGCFWAVALMHSAQAAIKTRAFRVAPERPGFAVRAGLGAVKGKGVWGKGGAEKITVMVPIVAIGLLALGVCSGFLLSCQSSAACSVRASLLGPTFFSQTEEEAKPGSPVSAKPLW